MKEILLYGLKGLYGIVGIIGLIAYLPTLKDIYFKKIASANKSSYLLWSFTLGVSSLYVFVFTNDILLQIFNFLGFLSCFLIYIGLILLEKKSNFNYLII